jgi:hypothetical protein
VVGAEAGKRASVGMASSRAGAESAGARKKGGRSQEEPETQGREKKARTTQPQTKFPHSRRKRECVDCTESAGLSARTAGSPKS